MLYCVFAMEGKYKHRTILTFSVLLFAMVFFGCNTSVYSRLFERLAAKEIISFQFLSALNAGNGITSDCSAVISGNSIAITVPYGTNPNGLIATFKTTGTSVQSGSLTQISGLTANDFSSPVIYRVTAEDESIRDYLVTVTVALNPAKEITSFQFTSSLNLGKGVTSDCSAVIAGTSINITVPYGTDPNGLIATFATTGASVAVGGTVQTSGATSNDFTSPVTYTVTAADGTTQNYIVTVTVALNPAKEITSFQFTSSLNLGKGVTSDCSAVIAGTSINITVPYGTDPNGLIATFATTGASVAVGGTVQTSGATSNDFTSPVTYTVTAADGTTQNYLVTVTVALNPAKEITSFQFTSALNLGQGLYFDCAGSIIGNTITVKLPSGCAASNLIASFTTTGQTVAVGGTTQISGATANDFSGTVTYTVTAADGTTKDFYVTVVPSTNSFAASTFATGSHPWSVAVNTSTNIVYAANYSSQTVTYLNALTGAILGNYATSAGPWAVAVNPGANILYVACYGSNRLDFLNATTGASLGSYSTGGNPYGVAVNPGANIVYVINRGSNTVNYFNATTGASLGTYATGSFPTGVAVNPSVNRLYVANADSDSVRYFNATTGANLGSYSTGNEPYGVAVNPTANIVYVVNHFTANSVSFFNATTGASLGTYSTGSFPYGAAVHIGANILYVTNNASNTVTFFNATTGAYVNGTLGASSFSTGTQPVGVAVHPGANILYITNYGGSSVTFYNAATGQYLW